MQDVTFTVHLPLSEPGVFAWAVAGAVVLYLLVAVAAGRWVYRNEDNKDRSAAAGVAGFVALAWPLAVPLLLAAAAATLVGYAVGHAVSAGNEPAAPAAGDKPA